MVSPTEKKILEQQKKNNTTRQKKYQMNKEPNYSASKVNFFSPTHTQVTRVTCVRDR